MPSGSGSKVPKSETVRVLGWFSNRFNCKEQTVAMISTYSLEPSLTCNVQGPASCFWHQDCIDGLQRTETRTKTSQFCTYTRLKPPLLCYPFVIVSEEGQCMVQKCRAHLEQAFAEKAWANDTLYFFVLLQSSKTNS